MKHLIIILTTLLTLTSTLSAQTEVELRPDGIVVPRTTTGAVSSPVEGMLIYDTSIDAYQYYDGSIWSTLGSGGAGAFERSGTLVRQQTGTDTDDFIFGRDALPPVTPISDTLFFFDQSKGAFRGGRLSNSDAWSPNSLGTYSFAYGNNTKASGFEGATALGFETTASGNNGATALGFRTTASGVFGATALGRHTTASGHRGATALGSVTTASGNWGATALGFFTTASGDNGATSIGFLTEATGDNCTVVGRYNDTIVTVGQDVIPTSPLFIVGNGDSGMGMQSNAMVVRKNGLVSLQNYSFPIPDGSANQVMTTDGSGQLSWSDDSGGGAFERSGTLVRQQTGTDTDDFIFGRDALPPATAITDTLMFFDQSKGAFRGGGVSNSDAWAPDSLGGYSFAYGFNSKASGNEGATALGSETTASGDIGATALGHFTTASGDRGATALGRSTTASGDFGATALGVSTRASGDEGATALGSRTTASGGSGATALGSETTASGDDGATALGFNTEATGDNCTVVGRYNETIVTAGQDVTSTSPLFIVGNGDSGVGMQSNALVVRKDGQVSLQNYVFPIPDGSSGQVVTTDGNGQLSWINANASFACPAGYTDIGSFCIQTAPDNSGATATYYGALDACITQGATLPSYAQFYEASKTLNDNDNNWLADVAYNAGMRGTKSTLTTPMIIDVEFFATKLKYRCMIEK